MNLDTESHYLELPTPAGETIKALPAERKQDDTERVKEAKARFADCRKMLKQVVDFQTARFRDALSDFASITGGRSELSG